MERKPQGRVLSSYFSHSTEKISPLKLGSPWECSPFHSSSSRCLPLATSAPDWTPACHRCDSGHQKLSQGHVIWVWRESLDGPTHEWMERQRHIHTHTHGMDGQTDIGTFMPKWDYFVLKAAPRLFHEWHTRRSCPTSVELIQVEEAKMQKESCLLTNEQRRHFWDPALRKFQTERKEWRNASPAFWDEFGCSRNLLSKWRCTMCLKRVFVEGLGLTHYSRK